MQKADRLDASTLHLQHFVVPISIAELTHQHTTASFDVATRLLAATPQRAALAGIKASLSQTNVLFKACYLTSWPVLLLIAKPTRPALK